MGVGGGGWTSRLMRWSVWAGGGHALGVGMGGGSYVCKCCRVCAVILSVNFSSKGLRVSPFWHRRARSTCITHPTFSAFQRRALRPERDTPPPPSPSPHPSPLKELHTKHPGNDQHAYKDARDPPGALDLARLALPACTDAREPAPRVSVC